MARRGAVIYAVHFENDPQSDELQRRHGESHLAYLARHTERIVAAGALGREGGAPGGGALWLVRATSELEARELVEGDPFFVHGVRRTVRVWRYHPEGGVE
jgi:uncharacterized protein YciI